MTSSDLATARFCAVPVSTPGRPVLSWTLSSTADAPSVPCSPATLAAKELRSPPVNAVISGCATQVPRAGVSAPWNAAASTSSGP